MSKPDEQRMSCMEVWGGNQSVDRGVVMSGLDAWVYSRPHGGAASGGDVHYVSSCATGRVTRLLVADVSGHGSGVSEAAESLRRLMQRHVNYIDQRQFVRAMNRRFAALPEQEEFATAVVATFFAPTRYLSLCNAGHPPPLLHRAKTKQWMFLEQRRGSEGPSNVPLGVLDLARYEQFGLRLHVGDMVVCYTDWLTESRGTDGRMLGKEGLLEIVRRLDMSDSAGFIPSLLEAIAGKAEGNLTHDDVTVLVFRSNGLGHRMRDNLLAPFRMIGRFVGSLLPGGEPMAWPEPSLANLGGAMFPPLNQLWGRKKGDFDSPEEG